MELSLEQVNQFCTLIDLNDIKDFIKNHQKEYQDYLIKNNLKDKGDN